MIPEERRHLILDKIKKDKSVTVQELADSFNITNVTARRDLDILAEEGVIKRSHGGAMVIDNKVGHESLYEYRADQQSKIKSIIGKKAASLIENGECIGIDIGTTAYEVSKNLGNFHELTVVTASIPVVCQLLNYPNINVMCVGGRLSRNDKSLNGHNAIRTIEEYVLDKVFIGVAGVSFEFGFTLFNMDDSLVKRVLLKRSREVIILLDSSKIGTVKYAKLCNLDEVNKIITDSGISKEDINRFQSFGIEVIIADEN